MREAWEGGPCLILAPPGLQCDEIPASIPPEAVFGLYSTGTSGRKLVLYSRANIETSVRAIFGLFDEARFSSIFCYPQPFHTFGLLLGYVAALILKKELVAPEGPYSTAAHQARARLGDEVITLGTPTHFKDLLGYRLRPSYGAIVGGAKVEASLWRDLRDRLGIEKPSIGYGATEASPGLTHLPPGREPREDGEVGFPLPHVELRFSQKGFSFRGPNVCLALVRDGRIEFPREIEMADELYRRDDGVLVFKGRHELLLNRGGEKFLLEEIEAVLKARLGVEAICVAIPDPRLGSELGIAAKTSSPESVYRCLKEVFLRDFDPVRFREVDDFPVDASAKIDRHAVRRFFPDA